MSYILKGVRYLFQLPINEFVTGDSLRALKYLPEGEVDLHFWDIPYNISNETSIFRDYRRSDGSTKSANISFNFDETEEGEEEDRWDHDFDPIPFLDASIPCLHSTGSWIIWCAEQQHGHIRDWAVDRGFYPKQMLCWVKANPLPNFRLCGYRQATEIMIWIAKRPIGRKNSNFIFSHQNEMTNVFYAPSVSGKEKTPHRNQKPLSICQKIIRTHCKPGGIVLDAFSGSGSIALAAYSTGRNFIAIEKKERWNKVAEKRIREYQVVKEEKTDKFEQIKF
jgi:DNA modification methylase